METKLLSRIMAFLIPVSKISGRSANHDVDRQAIGSLMLGALPHTQRTQVNLGTTSADFAETYRRSSSSGACACSKWMTCAVEGTSPEVSDMRCAPRNSNSGACTWSHRRRTGGRFIMAANLTICQAGKRSRHRTLCIDRRSISPNVTACSPQSSPFSSRAFEFFQTHSSQLDHIERHEK